MPALASQLAGRDEILDDRVEDIERRRERKGMEKIDTETRFIRKIT